MSEDEIIEIQNEVRGWSESTVKHSADLSEKLARYYKAIFGRTVCSTCPGKIAGYISQILKSNPKQQSMKSNSKYRIKKVNGKDQLIQTNGKIPGLPIHISNANLTDEMAEKLLNSNYARFIEENTEEAKPQRRTNLLENKSVPPTENKTMVDTKATNPELQELLDSKNKKQLIELLQQNKISYNPDANKTELAKLVIENWRLITINPLTNK